MHGMQNGFRCTEKGEPGERGEKGDKGSSIDGVSLEFSFFIFLFYPNRFGPVGLENVTLIGPDFKLLPENNGPSSVYYRDRFQSSSPFGFLVLFLMDALDAKPERSIAYLERES
jgi:hypothetical protein